MSAEYEQYNADDVLDALQVVRKQYLAGEPLTWTGPDRLHFSVSAVSPEPSWHFSPEGLEYHAEQDRDFWDVWAIVAFQIGFHNGAVR